MQEAKEQIKKSVSLWLPEFKASEEPSASTSELIECPQVKFVKVKIAVAVNTRTLIQSVRTPPQQTYIG